MEIRYSIFDPTGNITALAESPVEPAERQKIAAAIMRRHPEVEQVGFLHLAGADALPSLSMAGGEFCGNASMCAAALISMHSTTDGEISLRVSGAAEPVTVTLRQTGGGAYRTELQMPPAREIGERRFAFDGLEETLPLVRMEGISHLIVETNAPFFSLSEDQTAAERAVRQWCRELKADGLGLLFLEGEGVERRMTPLVYVPCSGTVFWENSCASGSAAVGMFLSARSKAPVDISLREPGGILSVKSDARIGKTLLRGAVRLTAAYTEEV